MKPGDTQSREQGNPKRRMGFRGLWRPEDLIVSLGISRDTFERWKKIGMPYVQIGKIILVPEAEFLKWVKGHLVNSPSGEKGANREDAV